MYEFRLQFQSGEGGDRIIQVPNGLSILHLISTAFGSRLKQKYTAKSDKERDLEWNKGSNPSPLQANHSASGESEERPASQVKAGILADKRLASHTSEKQPAPKLLLTDLPGALSPREVCTSIDYIRTLRTEPKQNLCKKRNRKKGFLIEGGEWGAQFGEFFWLNRLLSYIFLDQPVFWSILSARRSENGEYSLISP